MTLPMLTQTQMLSIFNENGITTVSTAYWEREGVQRIMMSNGLTTFAFRLKKIYDFPEVIKRCEMFGITRENIPKEILEEFDTCFAKYEKFRGVRSEEEEDDIDDENADSGTES